jgi:hypothetical protein
LQSVHEDRRGELAALLGMEDLWFAATLQRHLQSLEAELCVKAVRELPAEHVPGEEIHDRQQVEEALLQRDAGDVGGQDLIHSRDQPEIQQPGIAIRWIT